MGPLRDLYRPSLTLLTDLYQLTMAYSYWHQKRADREAVFHLFYRKNPFQNGYALASGLAQVIDFLSDLSFEADDLAYMRELAGNDGRPLFSDDFLGYLRDLEFSCDVDAVPEGTVVFPHEPLVRVRGPILEAQIIETTLLNMINFPTLVATKAARICQVVGDDPVLEFGLRRAQGVNGALAASRAAYIGGCSASSNVLAGKLFGIPVRGTHAHSWVMSFADEQEAFEAYSRAMPNNGVFLVDTYDTLEGVQKAVEVAKNLRQRGHEMVGIRLDSGDLAALSIEARKLLDEGGFPEAKIVASNDLDEFAVEELKRRGAKIDVWGIGTKLVTAYDQPALGGVYKLAAIRQKDAWEYKLKLSNEPIKVSNPGIQQVRRYHHDEEFFADLIYNTEDAVEGTRTLVDLQDADKRLRMPEGAAYTDLLEPIFRQGKLVYDSPPLDDIRRRARAQILMMNSKFKRLTGADRYLVGLDVRLHALKTRLIQEARNLVR